MKRLTKSEDKAIAGVCAGFAEYFEVDPTIVRAIWAVCSLFSGIGIFAYIICALVMSDNDFDKEI